MALVAAKIASSRAKSSVWLERVRSMSGSLSGARKGRLCAPVGRQKVESPERRPAKEKGVVQRAREERSDRHGLGWPHSGQNLPSSLKTWPQAQVTFLGAKLKPHSRQNLPCATGRGRQRDRRAGPFRRTPGRIWYPAAALCRIWRRAPPRPWTPSSLRIRGRAWRPSFRAAPHLAQAASAAPGIGATDTYEGALWWPAGVCPKRPRGLWVARLSRIMALTTPAVSRPTPSCMTWLPNPPRPRFAQLRPGHRSAALSWRAWSPLAFSSSKSSR